jgi:hypothetical protein
MQRRNGSRSYRLELNPELAAALAELATKEGRSIEMLISVLLNEALTYRLRHHLYD